MKPDRHIRVLPANVANKIAAGEVVERPASVLKEIMENSIDAGAAQIDVEVAVGGTKLVGVSDNGAGMNRDDALLSVERHATSKIRDVDDIEKINTLGFRGEALAAIASVSRFRLTTCEADAPVGTELVITGGKIVDVRDFGCPAGSAIEVRDLFFNVPARRKFLRSQQTELAHLRNVFIVQALAHPAVGMSLKVDGSETYRLAANSLIEDRIRDLFGLDFLRKLKPVDHANSEVAVSGFVSVPTMNRSDRNEQYVFINGRPTTAPVINYAINEGYRSLMPADRHPSVFLFISLDPELVDVNVHPTKREVRFRHPAETREAVIEAIRRALSTTGPKSQTSAQAIQDAEAERLSSRPVPDATLQIENLPAVRAFKYPGLPMTSKPSFPERGRAEGGGASAGSEPAVSAEVKKGATEPSPAAPWSWCRVLGQIGNLYVVLETEDGYALMDPHAAHERVLYERFMADVSHGHVDTQSLLLPETVELRPHDADCVRKNMNILKDMGFGIAEFGGDSFVVDAMPAYFADSSARILLPEITSGLERAGARGAKGRWREESIAQAACKAAVKSKDKLRLDEIEQLVVALAKTEMPYTCPHGRPTLIFTSFADLNRKFARE